MVESVPITCPLYGFCRTDCSSDCSPRYPKDVLQRIQEYKELTEGMFFRVQARMCYKNVSCTLWNDMPDFGNHVSYQDAKTAIEDQVGEISEVVGASFGQMELFQLWDNCSRYLIQYRIIRTNTPPASPHEQWSVNLREILKGK